jgi:hypothetical protein
MGIGKYLGIVAVVGAVTRAALQFVRESHRHRSVVHQATETAGDSPIPDDVLFEIMLRLPPASVAKLGSVSRQFHRNAQ